MGNFAPHMINVGLVQRALVLCVGTFFVTATSIACWTVLTSNMHTRTLKLVGLNTNVAT